MLQPAPEPLGLESMVIATASFRPLAHRLSPVLGLLLLVTLFAGGTHHHEDGRDHACAVCTVGHAPAVAADIAAPAAAPDGPERALHAPTPFSPRPARSETASSRAPPRS
jgi:hypothetical protein